MSIKVMNRVWEHSTNKGSALLLMLAIADHAHDDGTGAWPSIETLARKTRMSTRNVQYLIQVAKASGELKVLVGKGPRGCNQYVIRLKLSRGEKFAGVKAPSQGVKSSVKGVKSSVKSLGESPFTLTINHHKPSKNHNRGRSPRPPKRWYEGHEDIFKR